MLESTIPFAISRKTKEKVFSEDLLDKSLKDRRLDEYKCYYCNEILNSYVREKNPYIQSWFRHKSSQTICELSNYSKEEKELDKKYIINGESDRHKYLKKALRIWLYKQGAKRVQEEKSIFDDLFFYRRPDVYCEYRGYKLAFEIQVSNLSYKSLKKRSEFFSDNGIYCIWIVDWFIPNNTQADIDFIAHNPKENVFTVNLLNNNFELVANYVLPSTRKMIDWKSTIINLNQIKFDDSYQVYYYDTPLYRRKIEEANEKKLLAKKDKDKQQNKINQLNIKQLSLADKYVNSIEFMDFSNGDSNIPFIVELEIEYENFLPKIKDYFFKKIKYISENSRGFYDKPFLNDLVWNRHGHILEFLLEKSPYKLYVDGKDESNFTIWDQLIGLCYGFANGGYIDVGKLVPLINKHTNDKKYSLEDILDKI